MARPSPSRRQPTRARAAPPRRALGLALRLLAVGGLLWVGGFVWFIATLPAPAAAGARTDGVIVLTGGPGRLARGVEVLRGGAARRLLVSGVADGVRPHELALAAGIPRPLLRCCVDLGFVADDTRGNAQESAAWIARHRYRSVRLVTAAYHLPRARLELAAKLGDGVRIVGDGVPAGLPPWPLAREYSKLVARAAMLTLGIP